MAEAKSVKMTSAFCEWEYKENHHDYTHMYIYDIYKYDK